jgi:hypothetical protein
VTCTQPVALSPGLALLRVSAAEPPSSSLMVTVPAAKVLAGLALTALKADQVPVSALASSSSTPRERTSRVLPSVQRT